MNEELKDIKGSFFSKIGLYRNFIQHSMQQSLFNTIYILSLLSTKNGQG